MLTNSLVKTAAPIDAVGDADYESAFSNIAHAVIRRKAPALVPYELGFQLLDRAEDDSKAVGALLYTVGQKMLVIPLIFVNGELKGADAIYLQDDNLYLPLSEEWIKAILAHHQQPLGQGVPRSRASQGYTSPDLHQAYGLRPKYAAIGENWLRKWRKTPLETKVAALKDIGLVDFLTKHATTGQLTAFMDALKSDVMLADWYHNRFGFGTLKTAINQAHLREGGRSVLYQEKAAAAPTTRLLRYQGTMPAGLDASQQADLARDGWLIVDKRAEEEKATLLKTPGVLKNPSQSGVYDILRADGEFVKALVVCKPITRALQGNGLVRDGDMITVVALDGERAYTNTHRNNVWTNSHEPDRQTEGIKGLPTLDSLSAPTSDNDGTCDPSNCGSEGISSREPLRPLELDDAGESCCKDKDCSALDSERFPGVVFISPDCKDGTGLFYSVREAPGHGGSVFTGIMADYLDSRDLSPAEVESRRLLQKETNMLEGVVLVDVDDARPIHNNGFLHIPASWRALKVGKRSLHLGTPKTLASLHTKSAAAVDVAGDRLGFVVDNQRYAHREDAAWRLVDGFGLSVKDACEVLKSAEKSFQRVYVKAAAPAFPDMAQLMSTSTSPYEGGFSGPMMDAGQMAVQDPQQEPGPVPDYTFIRDMMQNAGQSGLPELTELGGLTSLLQTSSEDRIIDDKLPKLTQAVDAVAQLLLHLYIHTDVFVTRYGKADTKELEAGLKNTLESLGKTLYHLKHRTVSSQPEATLVDQDLRDSTD